jgi:hypothetical protein
LLGGIPVSCARQFWLLGAGWITNDCGKVHNRINLF